MRRKVQWRQLDDGQEFILLPKQLIACCACGLVHEVSGRVMDGKTIVLRMKLHKAHTERYRNDAKAEREAGRVFCRPRGKARVPDPTEAVDRRGAVRGGAGR